MQLFQLFKDRLSSLYAPEVVRVDTMTMPPSSALDSLDARIVALFSAEPQVGVLAASRRLGVARGTVQARLDRLEARGVIRSWAPQVDPAAIGYAVTAFCTLEIRQGQGHAAVTAHLRVIPEVLEAHTITGTGDLLVRVVARDNADLQRVLDAIIDDHHVLRAHTAIALAERIAYRSGPLVQATARPAL